MMCIGIIHHSLNSCGGGERLSLATIEALKDNGYKVVLATVEPTDWHKVRNAFGDITKPDKEFSLTRFQIKAFGIYLRQMSFLLVSKLRKECNLIINTHGDLLPLYADVTYMHYPTFILTSRDPEYAPSSIKYVKSVFWRLYFEPYRIISTYFSKKYGHSGLLLTNSEFSRNAIKKYVGRDALVLYPPVDIEKFLQPIDNGKENLVVSIGRYTPEKRYDFVLRVAKELPEVRFVIVGASSGKISTNYFNKLVSIKESEKIDNVVLVRDAPLQQLLNILKRGKVYLHAMEGEHFGIAIVEAMASGLIPVVHKSGGAWTDIVKYGSFGFGYKDLEEAVNSIELALERYDKMKKKVVERSKEFSKSKFKERVVKIVKVLEEKLDIEHKRE